jgi:replicative DNA helicase
MSDPLINLEAEQELLGSLMNRNEDIDRVADVVSSEDFAEPVHALIYSAIVRQASLGKAANPVTIKGFFENNEAIELLGGVGYLARLTGNAYGLVTLDTAKVIADLAVRRDMRAGLATAGAACADLEATLGEIVSHADAALNVTGKEQIHQPTGGECLDELIASFSDRTDGVRSGLTSLDELLGPMRPKQLIIGAGRPGMGKTALALSYALGAARNGHGVLFVSLEMASKELAARMAADLCFDTDTQVPFAAIRDGRLSGEHYRKVGEARDYMHSLPFQVVDAGNLTVGRLNTLIRRHARRMAAKGNKLELVIVDYLQLLSPDTRGRSNYEAVSEVSRSMKALAKDHGVAVFALAQLSREVEKRQGNRPQLSDLRDSGQIEQDADAVLFLVRLEYYLRQDEPDPMADDRAEWEQALNKVAGQIEFILAKRRNGVTGTAIGRFYGAYQAVRG